MSRAQRSRGGRPATRRPPASVAPQTPERPAAPRQVRRTLLRTGLVVVLTAAAAAATALSALVRAFLDFGAGVLALVSLSAAVLWGLTATDRRVAYPDHRLVAQGVHRALGVAGLGFLGLHIWIKVAEGNTSAAAAAVPFTDLDQPVLIGLGTLAGYVFVIVAVTGVARSVFVSPGRARVWRALHMTAYLAWCAALLHGLKSGRVAASWANVAYIVCLAGVGVVLLSRLWLPRAAGTGGPAPRSEKPRSQPYTPPPPPSATATIPIPGRGFPVPEPAPPRLPERGRQV
ncbi:MULTISPECIES: hypothetical protein [unclassified Streptomyces]|uniref:Uncharacterized protein n=1 Tax=Streptomyces sp. NBC_00060 TaxID=2975636 RepID=A0AAU2GT64_9ACTN